MDRASVTSGAAFKTAVRGTLILVAILILSGIVAFYYLQREMLGALETQIADDRIVLTQIYGEGGQAALIEVINSLRHPLRVKLWVVGLFDANGQKLAGNIDLAPDLVGWSRRLLTIEVGDTDQSLTDTARFYVNQSSLDQFSLVVGRNLSLVDLQERRLIIAFAVMGVVIGASFLLLGYWASLQSLRKLDAMAKTLDLVSKGDEHARLLVSPQNDQIDRVSHAMNAHLDRLSVLMQTTRASAAAIAHDLRTPLSRAFLAVDRAQTTIDAGEDPRPMIDEIEAELTRLRSIFDAILRISRLEQDNGTVGFTTVPLAPLLTDLAETFGAVAEEHGQTLTLAAVAADLSVKGEGPMLSQLLANLIQNAINHCAAGNVITLGADSASGAVRIWLADTGLGIPKSEQDRVFELFYRIDPNRTGGGNGLGMALVKAIADRLGGRITLSDAGPGLRVEVIFPVQSEKI